MISTEDAWNARARERERTPAIDLEDEHDREIKVVVRMLGAAATHAQNHSTIMAHMIDPVVVGYGGERGLSFEKQMMFLLGKNATYLELAYFLEHYDHVMSFVEERLTDPSSGYDFIDGVWDVMRAHENASPETQEKTSKTISVEETDAGTVATASVDIRFDVFEGQDAEEVLDAVVGATNKLLQIHSSESGSAQLLR